MNKKVKLKGRLNMYMRWPVLLSALLLVATVLMYLVDYRAGLLMTACFVLYVAAAIVIYFYLKPSIVDELVNFAIEFAQVQHNLIHDLEIPYAILDETGKLLWANSCMKEIMGEFIDMKNISTLIPDIKRCSRRPISYLHFICSMRQRYRCPGRRSRIRSSSAVLYW